MQTQRTPANKSSTMFGNTHTRNYYDSLQSSNEHPAGESSHLKDTRKCWNGYKHTHHPARICSAMTKHHHHHLKASRISSQINYDYFSSVYHISHHISSTFFIIHLLFSYSFMVSQSQSQTSVSSILVRNRRTRKAMQASARTSSPLSQSQHKPNLS